jgi:mono/diheme cytochrome c family protein
VAARHGDDPVVADLVVSAVNGRELSFLGDLLSSRKAGAQPPIDETPVVRALAATVVRRRDAAGVQRLVSWAVVPSRPRWQRLALLDAMAGGSGRASAPPSAPARTSLTDHATDAASDQPATPPTGAPPIQLPRRPDALLALGAAHDTALAARARRATDALEWPGKSRPRVAAPPLTPAERQRFAAGRTQFLASCAGCHQANGAGQVGLAKSLVQSRWVLGQPLRLIRIVQNGKEGEMLMPPVGGALTSEQLAAVLTYIRRSWGNEASPIEPALVDEVRGATSGRTQPWTEEELLRIRR